MHNRRAVLHVRNLPVIDTFQFFGPNDTPGLVDFRIEWEATGPAVVRGMGAAVPPTDPGAFLGISSSRRASPGTRDRYKYLG